MAYKTRTKDDIGRMSSGNDYIKYRLRQWSYGSPTVDGRLRLQPNNFSRDEIETTELQQIPYEGGWWRPSLERDSVPEFDDFLADLRSVARSKFVSRIRTDTSSLLVTAASWRQSRDMIVKRSNQFGALLDSVYHGLTAVNRGKKRRVSYRRTPLADQILEIKFGWVPLLQDIGSAMEIVCAPLAPVWAKGSKNGFGSAARQYSAAQIGYTFSGRVTLSSKVSISNPNLFLANKLGLINPGLAAWDLIPWSFVVGMFVNANQLIGSVTDFVGLRLDFPSRTETYRFTQNKNEWSPWMGAIKLPSVKSSRTWRSKSRITNGEVIPPYSVMTRVPELNWGLAVTASSLLVQKAARLNGLIKVI